MGLVVVASAWGRISYNFLFFLAGLQAIPRSVIEAAAIDGARFWTRFWTIVFPLLSPTTFFLLVVNIVYAFFETFGVIHTITSGGPQQATTILVYKVYADGFVGQDLGSSAAQSVILLVVVGHPDGHPVQLHRAEGALLMSCGMVPSKAAGASADGMVARPHGRHWLILGVLVIFFPIWLAFVASTVTPAGDRAPADAAAARRPVLRELPRALVSGVNAPVARMLLNSMVMALGIAIGKIAISLLSAFAIVYFRFPVRKLFFWLIFLTLMLPVEVRIVPTYEVVAGFGMLNSYSGPDPAADRLGHGDLPVPAILPDRARRTGRGRAGGRRAADALLRRYPAADEPHQHRGAVRHPLHLRLEPVPLAAADHHRPVDEHHRHGHQADVPRRATTWPTGR